MVLIPPIWGNIGRKLLAKNHISSLFTPFAHVLARFFLPSHISFHIGSLQGGAFDTKFFADRIIDPSN
jgi:hypothetical protein